MVGVPQSARRVGVAVKVSAALFLLAIGSWVITAFQGATADSFDQAVAATLATERLAYAPDEPISFTLHNQSQADLTVPSDIPFAIARDNQVVYQPFDDAEPRQIAPGKTLTWTWDQHDALGDQVLDGTYDIAATYTLGADNAVVKTTVVILPASTMPVGFEVAPTSGTAPFEATLRCPVGSGPVSLSFGDDTDTVLLESCPATLSHTYTKPGTFLLTARRGDEVIGKQSIAIAAAAANSVRGSDTSFLTADSLRTLFLALLAAAIASGLISYLIIGRPVAVRRG